MPDSTLNRRSVALLQTESNRLSYPQKTAESRKSSGPMMFDLILDGIDGFWQLREADTESIV
jgi:hypothetical protein